MSETASRRDGSGEAGDRASFLGRIRDRQGLPTSSGPHPPPPPPATVPTMEYRALDGIGAADTEALLQRFIATASAMSASVDVLDVRDGAVEPERLQDFVGIHAIRRAVISREQEIEPVAHAIRSAGVELVPYEREAAAGADLGITAASHAVAATGSIVVDSATAGSRAVSLLPRVHLAVVPIDRLVPTPSDVLRSQGPDQPSCRVVITGPSRTGDIEQLLTLGAHGPVALHIVVLR